MRSAILVLIASCGRYEFAALPDASPAVVEQRLTATTLQTPDGLSVAVGMYDAELDTECSFVETATDWVCLPLDAYLAYRDASCTERVAVQFDCATPATYVAAYAYVDDTLTNIEVFRLAELIATEGSVYQRDTNGACVVVGGGTAGPIYALGDAIDTSQLIHGTLERTTTGGRLDHVGIVTSDGDRMPWAAHDRVLDSVCAPFPTVDGLGCAPVDASTTSRLFSDGACSMHLAATQRTLPPRFAYAYGFTGCIATDYEFFEITGPETTPAQVYSGNGACTLGTVDPMSHYYPATRITLQPLASRVPAGSTRLRAIEYDGGGAVLASQSLHDTLLDVACAPANTVDGQQRCLPNGLIVSTLFTDSACTAPIQLGREQINNCVLGDMRYGRDTVVQGPACDQVWRAYELGPQYAGGPLWSNTGGPCFQLPAATYFTVVREMMPDELVPLTRATPP